MKEEVKQYLDYVLKRLQLHGPVTAKAKFGGFGIYHEKIIFAAIMAGQLYFKVDETNRQDYVPYKSVPFVYPLTTPKNPAIHGRDVRRRVRPEFFAVQCTA